MKKEEEEDVALALKKQQEKRKHDLSKIKCFQYGELGHFARNCPQGRRTRKLLVPRLL